MKAQANFTCLEKYVAGQNFNYLPAKLGASVFNYSSTSMMGSLTRSQGFWRVLYGVVRLKLTIFQLNFAVSLLSVSLMKSREVLGTLILTNGPISSFALFFVFFLLFSFFFFFFFLFPILMTSGMCHSLFLYHGGVWIQVLRIVFAFYFFFSFFFKPRFSET